MKELVCACTGHRLQNLPFRFNEMDERCINLKERLYVCVENIIKKGVTRFVSGMAIGVDLFFAEIVIELRDEKYPDIKLEAAIPCETQAIRWSEDLRDRYYKILAQCDVETMLQKEYTRDCMQKRNRYLVDSCDYLIAVWDGTASGTGSTVRYAQENNKSIIIINPNELSSGVD